jgi:hypothetical protein
LPNVALVGTQSPQILLEPRSIASRQEADDCIEFTEAYGFPLDEAQKITLNAWMGTRADGKWAASSACHAMSRQNGKGDEIEAREAYGLVVLGERIIHTSHEVPTSIDAFERILARFTNYDDLRKLVKRVSRVNGMQGFTLRSGAEIKYRARTGGGGRGLTNQALLVYDEAQHLQRKHLAASSSTKATHPNPQTLFLGSAGFEFSEAWWDLRLEALRGRAERLAYVEHTAERCWIDDDGKFRSERPNVESRQAWADANPAFGTRISEEFLEDELLTLGPELFAQEHLGVWTPLPSMIAQQGAKLPEAAWTDTTTLAPPRVKVGELQMAFDVELDGSFSAISIASGTLADAYVETIDHRPGVSWLPLRLVELYRKWNPPKILMDGGSGSAAAILGEIRETFEAHHLDPNVVEALPSSQYRAACGSFAQAVSDGKVHRPEVENDRLYRAGLTARERVIGDWWVFDRRNSPEPIVSLTSAAMARSRLADAVVADAAFVDLSDYLDD